MDCLIHWVFPVRGAADDVVDLVLYDAASATG